MKFRIKNQDKGRAYRTIAAAAGIVINVVMAYGVYALGLPLYMDTIGTIGVAAVSGMLPGVIVAVISNMICSAFNSHALYYAIINVLVAVLTSVFVGDTGFKKKSSIVWYVISLAAAGGILGIIFQWLLTGGPQFPDVAEAAGMIAQKKEGTLYFTAAVFINYLLNLIDKSISAALGFLLLRFVPEDKRKLIRNSRWLQRPLSEERISKNDAASGRRTLLKKMSLMLSLSAISLAVIMSVISIRLYYESVKEEYTQKAINVARFVAENIDGDRIDDFLVKGEDAVAYKETKKMMYGMRDTTPEIEYLYVVRINERGCTFIIDLDTEDVPGYSPGEVVEFEEAFEPYLPELFAGQEIEPIESDDTFGWVMSYYHPVKNSFGKTVAYVGADVSMTYMSAYAREFIIKALLIFSGFCALILTFGLSFFRYHLIYPVGSMTSCAKDFVTHENEHDAIDESVKRIRALDIRTNDEIEELYKAVSKMEASMAQHMRDVRHYADATAKMQNGLIVTMADMVENRDSDTGAHVQKTAAYVRIILNGLKRKGYYAAKLTDKYMAEVEMSAPLHDVGKINIPDGVLNKPGRLEPDEFEIMKTHTTAGKKILENAISTVEGENYLKEARNMAAYHHERWDGKGYPDKLHGEVIPLSARVMAVADVFDALTSPRVYKPAVPLEKALQILEEGKGAQFDPKVVEVFMEALPEVKRVLRKYNNQSV